MEFAIYELFEKCRRDDLALLFFSGHGIVADEDRLYLSTRETRENVRGKLIPPTAVAASDIHNYMKNSYCKRQIVILDTCYSSAFAEGITVKGSSKIDINQQLGGKGRVILTSSDSTQKSLPMADNSLSIFTNFLVEGLKSGKADLDRDGYISIEELYEYTKDKVTDTTDKMTPQIFRIKDGAKIIIAKSPLTDKQIQESKISKPKLDNELRSEKGIDYTALEALLKSKRWQAADQETYKAMNKILAGDWSQKNLKIFPLTDLLTIERLWTKYSQGKFGFSAQKEVYLKNDGRLDGESPSSKARVKFGEIFGWVDVKEKKHWIPFLGVYKDYTDKKYHNLNFSLSAPKGHLPVANMKLIQETLSRKVVIPGAGTAPPMYRYEKKEEITTFGVCIFAKRLYEIQTVLNLI